jgi:hypothetical protein
MNRSNSSCVNAGRQFNGFFGTDISARSVGCFTICGVENEQFSLGLGLTLRLKRLPKPGISLQGACSHFASLRSHQTSDDDSLSVRRDDDRIGVRSQ